MKKEFINITPEGENYIENYYKKSLEIWTIPYKEHYVDTTYGKTFILECGSPKSPSLIFLHGVYSNVSFYREVIIHLAKHYHIFALDTIGDFGRSRINRRYKKEIYPDWLMEIFHILQIEQTFMTGISFGANISLKMVFKYPDRLKKVVALVPSIALGNIPIICSLNMIMKMKKNTKEKLRLLCQYLDGSKKAEISYNNSLIEELVDFMYENRQHKNESILMPLKPLKDKEIQSIKVPCTCFIGENDPFIKSHKTVSRLKRLKCKVVPLLLPGLGHFLDGKFSKYILEGLKMEK